MSKDNFFSTVYYTQCYMKYLSLESIGVWTLVIKTASPCIKIDLRSFVKYSKLFGIFLLKFAADVESNIISATFNGIPPGFSCLSRTSFLGNTCICTSLFVFFLDVTTSTWMKSCSTLTLPANLSANDRTRYFLDSCIISSFLSKILSKYLILKQSCCTWKWIVTISLLQVPTVWVDTRFLVR